MDHNKYMMKMKNSNANVYGAFAWLFIVAGCLGIIITFLTISNSTTVLQEMEGFLIGIGSVICICSGLITLVLCRIHDVLFYKKNYEEYAFYYNNAQNNTNAPAINYSQQYSQMYGNQGNIYQQSSNNQ